ncbi:hypothetical protein AB0M44_43820 [Streptosporangium subroseum]|uniref:hypothetical protein n=1 Tax=Streptosporangium subroseum TaxID=106412 RepID=UPI00343B5929
MAGWSGLKKFAHACRYVFSDAPAGLLSLSASQVVVPAHGSGTVTVTADLDRTSDKHSYSGRIAAAAAGSVLARTVVGVSTEDQPHHLVVNAKDRDGAPMYGWVNLLREGDPAGFYYSLIMGAGSIDVLLPEGTYSVWMWGEVRGTHGPSSLGMALLNAPEVTVEDDTVVNLDAATASEVKAVTPQETADAEVRVDYYRSLGDTSSVEDSLTLGTEYDSVWTQPTKKVRKGHLSVATRWRKQQPFLSVTSGKQSYDDLWIQPGAGLLPEGREDLNAVFAGAGNTADYAGLNVKGKIAVVRYGDTDDQVPAAVAAGAKLLLIVNDEYGRLRDAIRRTPLTVASLTRDEGEELISRLGKGPVRLHVESNPATEYLYDLVRRWDGAIPGNLTYQPKQRDLARVDVDFRDDPADEVDEYRFDISPYTNTKMGYTILSRAGRNRTDWVTADGVKWMSEANIARKTLQYAGERSYKAGSTTYEQWFGPIQRPRITNAIALPTRTGDNLQVQAPGWGDSGADHAGLAAYGQLEQSMALYQGDALVTQTDGPAIGVDLSPGRLPYRLVTTTERDASLYPYSTHTQTAWRFTSATAGSDTPAPLPLVQLDYTVNTDLTGRASRSAALTLTPSHLPTGPASTTIRSAGLDVSYDDGVTWSKEHPKQTADGWEIKLHAPSRAQYVTLRAQAQDKQGNSVEQTIVRAFGLK